MICKQLNGMYCIAKSLKNSPRRSNYTQQDQTEFLVKVISYWNYNSSAKTEKVRGLVTMKHIYFPKGFIGKRVRFKIEIVGDVFERDVEDLSEVKE